MTHPTLTKRRPAPTATIIKYRQGWDDGYDIGYADAWQDALKDPRTFCRCSRVICYGVEEVADGTAETCWYCTFLDGETPCPTFGDGQDGG